MDTSSKLKNNLKCPVLSENVYEIIFPVNLDCNKTLQFSKGIESVLNKYPSIYCCEIRLFEKTKNRK